MLNLSDTSIRLYRKKNGKVSVKLRSYLMVKTNVEFNLSTYLNELSCTLKLANGKIIKFEDVSFTYYLECAFQMNTMVHGFWASSVTDLEEIQNGIGILTLDYLLSFSGHQSEECSNVSYVVPVIKRSTVYEL